MDVKQQARQGFANRLQQALKEMGYDWHKQTALGQLFGVSGQAVRKWLSAESMPASARMEHLATLLNIRTIWLMTGDGDMRDEKSRVQEKSGVYSSLTLSTQEKETVLMMRQLPPAQKQALEQYIHSLAGMDSTGR